MNTATSFRLQLKECRSALTIYYIIILLIFAIASIGMSSGNSTSGLETSTALVPVCLRYEHLPSKLSVSFTVWFHPQNPV